MKINSEVKGYKEPTEEQLVQPICKKGLCV